jgi:hypothetical protein
LAKGHLLTQPPQWYTSIFDRFSDGVERFGDYAGSIFDGSGCTKCSFVGTENKRVWEHWSQKHTDALDTRKDDQVSPTKAHRIETGYRHRYLKIKAAPVASISPPVPHTLAGGDMTLAARLLQALDMVEADHVTPGGGDV